VYDLAVAGGGPAGLATAIFARQAGMSVVVVDKRHEPFDKACGEGLMPPGVALLESMGIDVTALPRASFAGIRFIDGALCAEGRFPQGSGLGIRRVALAAALRQRARLLGAELRDGVTALTYEPASAGARLLTSQGELSARCIVAADGLHSRLRQLVALERVPLRAQRFGVRRHFALAPWSPFVEVHFGPGVEGYVTPVGPFEVGVAFLWDEGKIRFDDLLQRLPALADRLTGATATSTARGAGPFEQRVARRHHGDVLALVGDAAGYLDPLTGEGVSLAFGCARALVDVLAARRPLSTYEDAYQQLSAAYYRVTTLMLELAHRPRLRRRFIRGVAAQPAFFAELLAVSYGARTWHSLGLGRALRFLGAALVR
jgi:flavin-dependent dehydrogenase